MAVLGHKTLSEAERYTRQANQVQLATAAFAKLEGRTTNKTAQTTNDEFGKEPKK
jgi:enterobacteria phage integrase